MAETINVSSRGTLRNEMECVKNISRKNSNRPIFPVRRLLNSRDYCFINDRKKSDIVLSKYETCDI